MGSATRSRSGGIVEDHSQGGPLARAHLGYTVACLHAVVASAAGDRASPRSETPGPHRARGRWPRRATAFAAAAPRAGARLPRSRLRGARAGSRPGAERPPRHSGPGGGSCSRRARTGAGGESGAAVPPRGSGAGRRRGWPESALPAPSRLAPGVGDAGQRRVQRLAQLLDLGRERVAQVAVRPVIAVAMGPEIHVGAEALLVRPRARRACGTPTPSAAGARSSRTRASPGPPRPPPNPPAQRVRQPLPPLDHIGGAPVQPFSYFPRETTERSEPTSPVRSGLRSRVRVGSAKLRIHELRIQRRAGAAAQRGGASSSAESCPLDEVRTHR